MAPGTLTDHERAVQDRGVLETANRPYLDTDDGFWPAGQFPFTRNSQAAFAWSYWGCSMLTALQESADFRLGELASCWRTGATVTVRNGPDSMLPQYATIDYPEGVVIVIRGTTNWRQMILYVIGSLLHTPSGFFGKVNQHFYDSSRALFQLLRSFYPSPSKPWFLIGHSYGAAVAQVLAVVCAVTGQACTGALTFGGPMAGSGQFYGPGTVPVARWANVRDPICELPPEKGAFGAITAAFSLLGGSVEAYVHAGNALIMSPDGTLASGYGTTAFEQCLDFVFHLPIGLVTGIENHYIREYLTRLTRCPSMLDTERLSRGFNDWPRIRTLNG